MRRGSFIYRNSFLNLSALAEAKRNGFEIGSVAQEEECPPSVRKDAGPSLDVAWHFFFTYQDLKSDFKIGEIRYFLGFLGSFQFPR